MKSLSVFLVLLFPILLGCNQENENPGKGEVLFSLELLSGTEGGREMQSLPPESYLQISVETAGGAEVLSHQRVDILGFGGTFASVPLELAADDYVLTEFLVISPENEVLYATPITGSPMAALVEEPLPLAFSVMSGVGTQLSMQVLNVAMLTPEDVGYVLFPFEIVSHFFLTVFGDGQVPTDAGGYIIQHQDTLKTFAIEPEVNTVSFTGDNAEEFTVVIVKSGFAKHLENFTIEGIIENYDNGIVPITLEPALTFVAVPYNDGYNRGFIFEFELNFTGDLTIDWGDGTIEGICPGGYLHYYEREGDYFVSVTGDVQLITSFHTYYGFGPMREINVDHLPELSSFVSGWNGGGVSSKIIDLSHNPKISYIDVGFSNDLAQLILPETNEVEALDIAAPNNLTTADLEAIISTLYVSVAANERMDGYINLESPLDPSDIAGPPSAATWVKLRSLRDDYGWEIFPDPGL